MGIIKGMTNEEYHSTGGISSSAVKTVFKKSLKHWKGEKRSATPAMAMGTAVHALLLEPERDLVVKGPKTKSSAAFKALKETISGDQVLLTEVEYYTARAIAKGCMADPTCRKALEHPDRQNEVSIFADCPETKLALRTRPDSMSEGIVYDVKTTIDSSPTGFATECARYAYPIQAAFYLYVCNLAEIEAKEFSFLAVEKTAPYIGHCHVVGPELMEWAHTKMMETLHVIAAAQKTENYGTGWGDYTILEKPRWL